MTISPQKLQQIAVVKAAWSHEYSDFDIWLSARQRSSQGLAWLFKCQVHGHLCLLLGAPATVHGPWKKQWHQGVIKLPPDHKECPHTIYTKPEWGIGGHPLDLLAPPFKYQPLGSFWLGTAKFGGVEIVCHYPNGIKASLWISAASRKAAVSTKAHDLYLEWDVPVLYDEAVAWFQAQVEAGKMPPAPEPDEFHEYLTLWKDPADALKLL